MRYFQISIGLRGCYIPDSSYVVECATRARLKTFITNECERSHEAYGFGGSKKEISAVAAQMWRSDRLDYLPLAIGFGCTRAANDRPFGVFVSRSTKADFAACGAGWGQ